MRTAQRLFETQPQPGQRPPAKLQHGQLQGRQLVIVSPQGERVSVRVGQYWPEYGFEVRFSEGGYPNSFSEKLKRQGWKIPEIEPPKNERESELARLAGKMRRSPVGESQQPPKPMPKPTSTPKRPDPVRKDPEYLAKRRKASAMRQTVAHEAQAIQIVSALLDEDFAYGGEDEDEYKKRAGGPADPWRQGNLGKFSFKGAKFSGKRPSMNGPGPAPAKPTSKPGKHTNRMAWKPGEEPEEKPKADLGKPKDRWKWKPTQENLTEAEIRPVETADEATQMFQGMSKSGCMLHMPAIFKNYAEGFKLYAIVGEDERVYGAVGIPRENGQIAGGQPMVHLADGRTMVGPQAREFLNGTGILENVVPGTASSGAAPAMSMSLPDPDKEKEDTSVANTGPKTSPGPSSTPSAGAAGLFGP